MRGLARFLVAAAALSSAAEARADLGRFALDDTTVPVDALVCVCASRASPPEILHIDGRETPPPSLWPKPAGGDAPRIIHLAMPWPERGPLRLLAEIPARARVRDLPTWGQNGTLGPGDYVLTAAGFAAETLHVRARSSAEERSR